MAITAGVAKVSITLSVGDDASEVASIDIPLRVTTRKDASTIHVNEITADVRRATQAFMRALTNHDSPPPTPLPPQTRGVRIPL